MVINVIMNRVVRKSKFTSRYCAVLHNISMIYVFASNKTYITFGAKSIKGCSTAVIQTVL